MPSSDEEDESDFGDEEASTEAVVGDASVNEEVATVDSHVVSPLVSAAGHDRHEVCPVLLWYRPAEHNRHDACPVEL